MYIKLKNDCTYGLLFEADPGKRYIFTFNKQKTDDRFGAHSILPGVYVCHVEKIMSEVAEVFDYRFLLLCDVFGTGDVESWGEPCEDGVIFRDVAFHNHPGWVAEDRDTIMKKILYTDIKEYVVYKDIYKIDTNGIEEIQTERNAMPISEWFNLRDCFDPSNM